MNTEQVLVCPKQLIPAEFGERQFVLKNKLARDLLFHALSPANVFYMNRDKAEGDEEHVQLIPYCLIQSEKGDLYCYKRTKKGGEARLHDLYSIGIGGHINPSDDDGKDVYQNGFRRELAEEIFLDADYSEQIIGVIYDGSTPVGRVHLGIVHLLKLSGLVRIGLREQALSDGCFRSISSLRQDVNLENWSKMVLENLL